ncbi:MAG: ATP phosphoribosyltransferase regulatory subunit [Clostridiales bacterium]|nr:ATP phosphoribosyltransferase regulatory subunit [Candidatus Blautia equi]
MQRIFHTPEGVRDIYENECAQKRTLKHRIQEVFHHYGYKDIETPSFEYFEVFSKEVGTIPSKDLYKFFDREGNTLVLRPDFTPSISRACATYFAPDQEVVSLCYTGNTFVNSSSLRGQMKQNTQMGVEKFGVDSAEADAEILAMTVECLKAAGLTEFQVSVGQIDYFKSLLKEAGLNDDDEERLRSLISQKNYFGVEDLLSEQNLSEELVKPFRELPQLFGGAEILQRAKELTKNADALKAVERLEEIYDILKIYGCEDYISFDFGMVSKIRYYTGITLQAFTYGTGEALIKGGRYDELMKHFGRPAPAVGFGINLDSLLLAMMRQKIELNCEDDEIQVLEYTKETRAEAIKEAAALRAEGKNVALKPVKEA